MQKMQQSQWMASLPRPVTERKLSRIFLPGSHNASSFFMDSDSQVTSDFSAAIRLISSEKFVRKALAHWMKEQILSIEEQLELGIRYLDIKVSKIDQEFFTINGLRCGKVKDVLQSVYRFVTKHQKEVVLVHLRGLYNCDQADLSALASLFSVQFNSLLFEDDDISKDLLMDVSLRELWRNQHQVIGLVDGIGRGCSVWDGLLFTQISQGESDAMGDVIEDFLSGQNDKDSKQLKVFTAAVTVSMPTVMAHPFDDFEKMFGRPATRQLTSWLRKDASEHRDQLAIVCADFVDEEGFVDAVISLNR